MSWTVAITHRDKSATLSCPAWPQAVLRMALEKLMPPAHVDLTMLEIAHPDRPVFLAGEAWTIDVKELPLQE